MHNIFYFTDLHGQLKLFHAIKDWCHLQDSECTIIYGGDAADRGEDGYQIMKELLDDKRIIYLYGNHEDLFVRAAKAVLKTYEKNKEYLHNCNDTRASEIISHMHTIKDSDVELYLYNGGNPTLTAWLCDGANKEFVDNIATLPVTFSYGYIDFCHAGGNYNAFKEVSSAEYNNIRPNSYAIKNCIWDRNSIPLGWETSRVCIHGHTPTIHLPSGIYGRDKRMKNIHPCAWFDRMGGKSKRGGMKIDMDTATAYSGRIYVLNCLTGIASGFYDPNIPNGNKNYPIKRLEDYKIKLIYEAE